GNLADFLLARLRVFATLHELEVVDHDEADALVAATAAVGIGPVELGLEAAHLRAKLEDRERRRVVDPNREAPEVRRGLRELAPILRAEVALAELADVDPRLAAEHAVRD